MLPSAMRLHLKPSKRFANLRCWRWPLESVRPGSSIIRFCNDREDRWRAGRGARVRLEYDCGKACSATFWRGCWFFCPVVLHSGFWVG